MLSTRIRTAKRFFNIIHRIEVKEIYSDSEIDPLLRSLENLNHDEWEGLRFQIDQYWRDRDDFVLRKIGISRLRTIFHRVLKDNDMDPLK
ncbi:MAG: hypothetical protein V3V41_02120 [Candidatus Heimdallarchaeota archaeon]